VSLVHARGEGGQDVVGTADDQGGAHGQARLLGGLPAQLAHPRTRPMHRRETGGVEACGGEDDVRNVPVDREQS
jgi:hypothetical protein